MRDRYVLHVCPQCGDHYQFAGFCDSCSVRLVLLPCIAMPAIERLSENSGDSVAQFIEKLRQLS